MASILDSTNVDDKAFPLRPDAAKRPAAVTRPLEVVGSCPKCGSPVYGRRTVHAEEVPVVKTTCNCNAHPLHMRAT